MNRHNNTPKHRLLSLLTVAALLLPLPLITACGNGDSSEASEAAPHIQRAETYADQGQYRSALLEVRNAIKAEPGNASHIVRLGELYMAIGAAREASELLAPWLEDHTQQVALPLARAYVRQGKHLSARETLEQYKPEGPEQQTSASLIRGEVLRISGDKTEALTLFRSLMEGHPSSMEAALGTIRSLLDLNKPQEAIRTAENWLQQNPPQPQMRYWKGVAQYRAGNLEAAAETLTDAAGDLPTSDVFLPDRRNILTLLSRVLTEQGKTVEAQVYNKILAENQNTRAQEQEDAAMAAIEEGNIDEAKRILDDMLEMDPENRQAALMLGTLATGTGDYETGSRLLTDNLDPETTPTPFLRAATVAQVDSGKREQALKTLERAMEARPNDNEILAMHGILALSMPEHQEAGIASLSKALANEPDRVRLRLAFARHYLRNEQPEQALAQLRQAFTARPDAWTTTGAYLSLLIQQGETREAGEIRDSLLNGWANQPAAILLASIADARLGNVDEAIKRLEELVDENPELQEPKLTLASLYAQKGMNEQAVDLLVTAANLNPEDIKPLQQAGQIYALNHSAGEVEAWLTEVADENPDLAQNADTLSAVINIRQGNLDRARNLLGPWQDSDSAIVERAMARLLAAEARAAVQAEDYATARTKAAEAIAMEPQNLRFALLTVGIAQAEGKIDEAFASLDAVEENFGQEPAAILSRTALISQKEGAEAAYDHLLGQWETSQEAALMPSLLRLARAEAPDSLDGLTNSWLSAHPDSVAAHMARAAWLMGNGQEIVAANHYKQVISRQPDNTMALNNLAWILREEDTDSALEFAERARVLAPENPAVLDTYGWILHLAGKHAEAKEFIERAVALAPDDTEIRGHLETVESAM